MRTDIRTQINLGVDRGDTYGWVPMAMLAAGVPLGIWGTYSLLGGGGGQSVAFGALAGWFVLLAIGYLGLQSLSGSAWYSLPVLLTLDALLEFVCLPAWRFAAGYEVMDSVYVHAMSLILIGFAAFWIGSLAFKREVRLRFVPQVRDTPSRVALIGAAMFVLGLLGNVLIWKLGLSLYLNTTDKAGIHESSLPFMGWLTFCSSLLQGALVVSAIEVLGKRSDKPLIKAVFWLSFVSLIGFGLISAMKSGTLFPLLLLVLVYSLTRGRIPRIAFLIPLLLLPIFPFAAAYRANLQSGYAAQVNTIAGQAAVLGKSFADVAESPFSGSEMGGDVVNHATDRLSLLTFVHDIIGLPAPSLLNGNEKIWLAPLYPLVPRFLWKDKPVFNKGVRLSLALGRGGSTSSAPTQIGDLYSMYGTIGVVIGMLVYGICFQLFMNWVSGGLSEKGLFVYIMMLMTLLNLENDVVAHVGSIVQNGITLLALSYVVYGRPVSSPHIGKYSRLIGSL